MKSEAIRIAHEARSPTIAYLQLREYLQHVILRALFEQKELPPPNFSWWNCPTNYPRAKSFFRRPGFSPKGSKRKLPFYPGYFYSAPESGFAGLFDK